MLDITRHQKLIEDISDKIYNSNILIAGAGGLGSTVLENLIRIGFRNITIFDPKKIDPPDLNRQILYDQSDIGKEKVLIAKEKLLRINPECNITIFQEKFPGNSHFNAKCDLAFDCLDNIESRFILDDFCQINKIPLIHAAVEEYKGQITIIYPGKTKSLKQILTGASTPIQPQVLPPTVIIAASIQVSEALKILKNDFENSLLNKMLLFNIYYNDFEIINV
ncbi:MAG: HesA/MoeB/ThiF family protein [Thermosipho sp. (in: Bacteria)]|nr:HesA/MoeB/ThiF family protein [Thermosipho sp. (in: thermotogales)]